MLRKIFLTSAIAVITTGVAVANPAPYVGASVGITTNTNNVKVLGSDFAGGAYRGIPFNVFAGYGGAINQALYLAGEVSATVASANISDDNQLKSTYSYSASIIPGLMLSEHTLAYARAGVVSTRFPSSTDTYQTGAQAGVGLQTCVTQHVDLRGEYTFVAYKAKDFTVNDSSVSSAPRSDQVSLGLIYKFD